MTGANTKRRAPRFQFWTRGEVVRLGLIMTLCAIALIMPEHEPSARHYDGRKVLPAAAAGAVRSIRVTPFNFQALSQAEFGD